MVIKLSLYVVYFHWLGIKENRKVKEIFYTSPQHREAADEFIQFTGKAPEFKYEIFIRPVQTYCLISVISLLYEG